jgi:hypothetical protein
MTLKTDRMRERGTIGFFLTFVPGSNSEVYAPNGGYEEAPYLCKKRAVFRTLSLVLSKRKQEGV